MKENITIDGDFATRSLAGSIALNQSNGSLDIKDQDGNLLVRTDLTGYHFFAVNGNEVASLGRRGLVLADPDGTRRIAVGPKASDGTQNISVSKAGVDVIDALGG